MKLMSFWSKFFIALAITILATTGAVVGVFAGQKEQIDMGGSIKYTVPYFTVTFLNYDDTVFETQQVAYGHDAVAPANNPTRPGYTFKSWTDYTNITSNRSVTANWIKNEAYLTTGSKWQAIVNASPVGSQTNIEQIEFVSSVPSGATLIGSVGVTNETATTVWTEGCGVFDVKAYYTALSTGKYKISFYSPYTIYAPENSGYLFGGSSNLTSISFGNFNTGKVTDMDSMFYGCSKLTELDVSSFNTSKVTTMYYMFYRCFSLTSLSLSNFNTSNVTDISYMFYSCKALTSLNVSSFITSNVTKMAAMFYGCSKLTSLNLSSFDMTKVTSTGNMLYGCSGLTEINTPRTIGSEAVALPDNGKWINNANNNGPYSQITGAGMNSITLVIARNLILNYEEAVNCETRSAVLSGVTVTNNFDGSFTLNGTQTGSISLASVKVKLNKGDRWGCYYTYISGSYTRTSGSLVAVDLKKENQDSLTTRTYISYGDPGTTNRWIGDETVDQVTSDETGTVYFWIWYNPGTSAGATEGGFTFNNLRIKLTFFRYYEAQTSSTLYCCKDAGLPKTVPVPTMEGKDFDGYYGIVDGAGIKYYDKDGKLLVTNFPDQANIRLYPKWTTKKHTTTINPNGGKYNNSTSNTTKTLEENQASDILTSVRDGYFNSSYTDTASRTYEAIYAKNAGVSFNGTASSFGVIPRTYMYTDKILISFEAYSSNWSNLNSQVMLSCTQNGGWSFGHSSGNVSFIVYDSGRNGYMPATSNVAWSSLSAGWHEFTGSFDGQYARLYIDGQLCGMSYLFKGTIKYHASNSIIVGGEAGSAASPDDSYFNGKIRNVIIANDYCDANTISTTAPTNNTGTPYITVGSTANKTVTAQWQQDVVVDLDNCVTKPYTNLQLTSNTNGAWATNKTSDGNYEYVFTFNSYKNASISAGPHIQGLSTYMTHGQRYRITITAKSSKTFSVPMRFESSAPDASKTINLTTSYQTFYLDFTYDSTTQYHSFTFYSKNYTAGQTITFKDIRISKLLAPSSTYGTLPTLTKTGYTFDGWWTAASNGTKVAENTTLTSNSRHTLYPRWIINKYSLDIEPNGGTYNGSSNKQTITQDYNSSYTFKTPSRTGYTFNGWSIGRNLINESTSFNGSSTVIKLGRTYMYTDQIYVAVRASMTSWAEYKTGNMRLVSCTEGGGWNFEPNGEYIQFACYDSGVGYKVAKSNIKWADLASGYHTFAGSFDGSYARVYVDGILVGTSEEYTSGKIGYHASNGIFVGAEAGSNTTTPVDGYFKGTINYVTIVNSATLTKPSSFTFPAYNSAATAQWTLNESYLRENWKTALKNNNANFKKENIKTIQFVNAIPGGSGYTQVPVGATTSAGTTAFVAGTAGVSDIIAYVKANSSDSTKYDVIFYSPVTIFAPIDSSSLFYELTALSSINFGNFNTSNVTDMSYMFRDCSSLTSLNLSSFDTSNVTNMDDMFWGCSSLTSLNLSSFDTSNVTDMSYMFYNCSKLTSLNVSNFNTSKVTTMSDMFNKCSSLTSLNLSSFDTSNVTVMSGMFHVCSSLTSLNLSNFNTSKVTDMFYMFANCSSLTSLNVSSFNTSNVTNMGYMFSSCSKLTSLNVSNFNTGNVTDVYAMFQNCSKLTSLNLSSFDMSKVTNTTDMFKNCSALTTIYTPKTMKSGTSIALPSKTDYAWYKSTDSNRNTPYTTISSSNTNSTLNLRVIMRTITITWGSDSNGNGNWSFDAQWNGSVQVSSSQGGTQSGTRTFRVEATTSIQCSFWIQSPRGTTWHKTGSVSISGTCTNSNFGSNTAPTAKGEAHRTANASNFKSDITISFYFSAKKN